MSFYAEFARGAIDDDEYIFLARRDDTVDRDDLAQEDDWEDEDSEGGLIDED